MDVLLGFICLSIVCTVLIVRIMLWVTDKSAAGAITQHFQAAEYILEHHQPPPTWRKSQSKSKRSADTHADMIERLDKLIMFFEHSRFFQTEDARTALLEQLTAERANWMQRYQES